MKPTVRCLLCPRDCCLGEGQFGACGARRAAGGRVIADNYGKLTGLALDPIEKKPLARFYPGSMILSVGSYGCNLNCPFCQNSDIARARGDVTRSPRDNLSVYGKTATSDALVNAALSQQIYGNIGIAYTYNEPLVGYEFVFDTAQLAHESGLLNVVITNGYINEEPLKSLLPHLDAINIDLKGFTQRFYDRVCAPKGLTTVKRSIELAAASTHVEVTTLVVPSLNGDAEEIEDLALWLSHVDPQIPLHLTRFHPAYHMLDIKPTPRSTILKLADIARQHLEFVYTGNM